MTAPYDHEALWLKAKMFLNLALEDGDAKTFDERALWASLALELLAKAALARVSPLLIAVPTEDGANILIAAGLVHGDARFESVKAQTLFARCARAYKPFNERQAQAIARARNDYLHGSRPSFTEIPQDAWWPKYWAQAVILVHAQDRTVSDLVGYELASAVERHLAQNAKNIEHRTEMLVERAGQRLAQHESGSLSARLAADWARPLDLTAGLSHRTGQTCPACNADGVLEGDTVVDQNVVSEQIAEDDYELWVDLLIASEYFSCPRCRLVLDGYELLVQADLPDVFRDVGDYGDYAEAEYGND